MKNKEDNRTLYYRPLSLQLKFASKMQNVACIDEGKLKGYYKYKPLEAVIFQGYIKSVRVLLTNLKGGLSVQKYSLTTDELSELFINDKPYSKPFDLSLKPIAPNWLSENLMIMVYYLVIEDFTGSTDVYMVYYVFDEKEKKMRCCAILDKFDSLSDDPLTIIFDDFTIKQNNEVNVILERGWELYKELLDKIN